MPYQIKEIVLVNGDPESVSVVEFRPDQTINVIFQFDENGNAGGEGSGGGGGGNSNGNHSRRRRKGRGGIRSLKVTNADVASAKVFVDALGDLAAYDKTSHIRLLIDKDNTETPNPVTRTYTFAVS